MREIAELHCIGVGASSIQALATLVLLCTQLFQIEVSDAQLYPAWLPVKQAMRFIIEAVGIVQRGCLFRQVQRRDFMIELICRRKGGHYGYLVVRQVNIVAFTHVGKLPRRIFSTKHFGEFSCNGWLHMGREQEGGVLE